MSDTSQWFVILRTLASLGAVLALIYGLSWAAKRYIKPEYFSGVASRAIRVVHSVPIENKKRLLVVEVGSKQLLLGVAEGSISYLCEVPHDSHALQNTHAVKEAPYVASNS